MDQTNVSDVATIRYVEFLERQRGQVNKSSIGDVDTFTDIELLQRQ